MKSKGYQMHSTVNHFAGLADDFMFIRDDIMKEIDLWDLYWICNWRKFYFDYTQIWTRFWFSKL